MFDKKIVIKVNGMSCEHCAKAVTAGLKKIDGVKSVKVSLKDNKVTINHKKDLDISLVENTINDLGYKYIGVI